MAATRLGFAPVTAVDVDEVALEAARETVRRNCVAVAVRLADVLRDELPAADVVVANIELRTVEALLARAPGRIVVASGYLAGQAPQVPGWESKMRFELDGWAADALIAK